MSFSFDYMNGEPCIRVDGVEITNQVAAVVVEAVPGEPPRIVIELTGMVMSMDMVEHELKLRPRDWAGTAAEVLAGLDAHQVDLQIEANMDMSTSPTQGVIDAIIGVLNGEE